MTAGAAPVEYDPGDVEVVREIIRSSNIFVPGDVNDPATWPSMQSGHNFWVEWNDAEPMRVTNLVIRETG